MSKENNQIYLPREVQRCLTALILAVEHPSIAADVRQVVEKGFVTYQVLLAWEAGEFSEGQAAKLLGVDRVALRVLRTECLMAATKGQSLKNAIADDFNSSIG